MADTSGGGGGASPVWLDTGDHAWQMIAATLVGLQIMPGLVILYSGIVTQKFSSSSALMAVYGFASTLLCWMIWAYKMSFGEQFIPIVGVPGPSMDYKYLFKQAKLPATEHHYKNGTIEVNSVTGAYGMADMVLFQFFFAAITVVLLVGSVLGRMSFKAWMLFVPLWVTFSYTVGAFSLWGGGFLWQWGVVDYAGGFVIHVSSGVAGITTAYWVGARSEENRSHCPPYDMKMVLAGSGLLWLGWSGFNGGATYSANLVSVLAILNTHLCTAASLLTWTALDMIEFGAPSVVGVVQGMMTGLVAITPAAGFVDPWAALGMGIFIAMLTWLFMLKVHFRLPERILETFDDALGVFYTHAVAGILGGLAVGLLAEPKLCTYLGHVVTNSNGWVFGGNGGMQFVKQIVGALFIVGWNVVVTSIIMIFIKYVLCVELQFDRNLLKDNDGGDDKVLQEEYAMWGSGRRRPGRGQVRPDRGQPDAQPDAESGRRD